MAKLQEDVLTIKLSRLIKDSDDVGTNLSPELVQSLEAVVQELAGAGVLVEINIA
jgi:hypothetical protein|tara:strand:+ start:383 stop:547 length:165 start_codon:yes stop_codon:yes gene_type:complete